MSQNFLLIAGFPDSVINFRGDLIGELRARDISVHVAAPDLSASIAVRDKLRARFPVDEGYPFRIQTWRDLQGPLLSAVQLETTILNILLF